MSFLRKKPFQTFQHNNIDKENNYGLTDVEKMIFTCFIGDISYAFRDDDYCGEVPEIVREMQTVLNSIIEKAPKYKGNTLYRFTKAGDKTNFESEIFINRFIVLQQQQRIGNKIEATFML